MSEQQDLEPQNADDRATTHNNSDEIVQTKSLLRVPSIFQGPKFVKCWKIFKYVYVIGVIVFGFSLIFLNMIDSVDDWLDTQQEIVINFLIEESVIYIILVLLGITLLKSVGMKDVLGLRTISVVILAYSIVDTSTIATLLLTMFIIGLLSSFSKLVEYQVIGHELQVVQGTPVEYIFKYIRKGLKYCISDDHKLKWFDPKWTFEISEESRKNKNMDIMTNLSGVGHALQLYCKCCESCHPSEGMSSASEIVEQVQSNSACHDNDAKDDKKRNYRHILCRIIYFIVAVIWTSVVEWVQPITELFLFAHNWDLSISNVMIIVLSEFCDFDKAVEAMFIINEIYAGKNIIDAKGKAVMSKVGFWTLGYLLVMPPTLLWAYFYHKKRFPEKHTKDNDKSEENDAHVAPNDDTDKNKKNTVKNGTDRSFLV